MDKEKIFMGVQLEEIKGIVKDNGRGIADSNLRLMKIDDDISEVKQEIRCMSEIISDTQKDINDLIQLNLEIRKENKKRDLIMNDILECLRDSREIMDRWKERDREYLKVGNM